MARIASLLLLAGLTAGLVGCGGTPATTATPSTPAPGPIATPATTASPTTPAALPADLYELDPAKHAPPPTPVAGKMNGKPFVPTLVEMQDGRITFRQGKDVFPDAEIVVNLSDDKGLPDGGTVVVKPTQKWHETKVSSLTISALGEKAEVKNVSEGYALTLELGKPVDRKVKGKIQLALPGDGKSYLAGTFEAPVLRSFSEPPGPADAPFVRGGVTHPAAKGTSLVVGYVAITGSEWVGDRVGMPVPAADDLGGRVESFTFRPRASVLSFEKGGAKYEFTKLPPGAYLMFARVENGPAVWQKVEVKAGDQLTRDFKLEAGKGGAVEVKTPADFTGDVRLAPTELIPADDPDHAGLRMANQLELGAKAAGGKATVADVPPGKYTLYTPNGGLAPRGTVEVTAGKTAAVELQPEKK